MPVATKVVRGGIDLGGTKIEAVIVDARNNVLGTARHSTPTSGGPAAIARQLAAAVDEAARAAGIGASELSGVGVGSPGVIDAEAGTVSSARNLPDWDGTFPLAPVLSEELGTPVFVGNDVQVATEAEYRLGAGKPYKSILGVFWGTGVGGGLILAGKPWTDVAARGRSATWWSRSTARAAPVAGRAAWRRTPAAGRWRRARGGALRGDARPTCSS